MSLEQKAIAEYTSIVNECSAVGIPNDHIPPYVMDIAVQMYIRGAKEQRSAEKAIPISPKILLLNGFKVSVTTEMCEQYVRNFCDKDGKHEGGVRLTFFVGKGSRIVTDIETRCKHRDGCNYMHNCDIESVQELKHALRLNGWNELADNFKTE